MTDDRAARRVLCVIPARGGSKRVPRKNLRPVAGVPMLERTIGNVRESKMCDRIVVSTDDDEIAELAIRSGAEVPFRRPAELADDFTPTAPVIAHAVDMLRELGDESYDFVLVVYATAIFLEASDLRAAYGAVVDRSHALALSVCKYSAPIERAWTRAPDGTGRMRHPEHALTRTQDLEPAYYDAGQFYFGTVAFWAEGGAIHQTAPALIELPAWRAIDIDTDDDLELAARWLAAASTED